MAAAQAPNGDEKTIRAIVFKEGEMYIGQCLEYDIAAQAVDLDTLVDRLELTIEAEFAYCTEAGVTPKDCISPAPNYYHALWDRASLTLAKIGVRTPALTLAMARAA
jgi:hypothetical protein